MQVRRRWRTISVGPQTLKDIHGPQVQTSDMAIHTAHYITKGHVTGHRTVTASIRTAHSHHLMCHRENHGVSFCGCPGCGWVALWLGQNATVVNKDAIKVRYYVRDT